MKNLTIIIPAYNNLNHLKNCYASIQRNAPELNVIFIDDGSSDGSYEWLLQQVNSNVKVYRSPSRVGHTVLYDVGIEMATTEFVGILHADMIIGPNYIENMLKHAKDGVVVCGTRVEPPLHPPGNEKIIMNFGIDFDSLNISEFEKFVVDCQSLEGYKNKTSNSMFAPWIISKSDFLKCGGHDHIFAPFPYEDSDIFQRWILNGLKLIQSRDAFVYHLTCRGHRWTKDIKVDDDYYKQSELLARREYIRKWKSWISNDDNGHPVIFDRYKTTLKLVNFNDVGFLYHAEPWFDFITTDNKQLENQYIKKEHSKYQNIADKFNPDINLDDVVLTFDFKSFIPEHFSFINEFQKVIATVDVGAYEHEIFRILVKKKENRTDLLNKVYHKQKIVLI